MKLFLASSVAEVIELIPDFLEVELDEIKGKTVTFIPTAANLEIMPFYVTADKNALEKIGMKIDECDIATADPEEIQAKLSKNDYIFISGGNTFYLLQELQRTGADQMIIDAVRAGKPYMGSSAGTAIMAQNVEYLKEMDDVKKAPLLGTFKSLDLVKCYPLPHYKCFPFTRSSRIIYREYAPQMNLVPINNEQVIVVSDDQVEVWNIET